MELDPNVAAFVAVIENESFTAAAKRLGLTKSAVSKRVRRLEEQAGVQLLARNSRGVRPTDIGARYYVECQRIARSVSDARAVLEISRETPAGTLRVSLPHAPPEVVQFVALFRERYPDVHLELDVRMSIFDEDSMSNDISIVLGPLPDSSLRARRLGVLRLAAAAAPSYLARAGQPRSIADLAHHDFVVSATGTGLDVWPTAEGVFVPRAVLSSNSSEVVQWASIAGLGIALLSDSLVAKHVETGDLVRVLPELIAPAIEMHVLYLATRHVSPAQRAFIDLLVETVEQDPTFAERRPRD